MIRLSGLHQCATARQPSKVGSLRRPKSSIAFKFTLNRSLKLTKCKHREENS